MRNILITGGAGFIGSRLLKSLSSKDPTATIWVLDNLHPQVHGSFCDFPKYPENVRFVFGDVADSSFFNNVVRISTPSLIYHLAAETGTGQSFNEVHRYCNVNVMGTVNLINSVRQFCNHETTKVILASSRAVYGEGAYRDKAGRIFAGLPRNPDLMAQGIFDVPLPQDALSPSEPFSSNSKLPVSPASVYASSKLMQEYLLKQAGEGSLWQATILRFQNVYGPGQSINNPYTGVLSIFARQLLEGKEIDIYEDGSIARDFVFVDDVVDALVKAAYKTFPHGEIIDIGYGKPATILEIAELLRKSLALQNKISVSGKFRVGDIRYACADISKAQKKLGWRPKVDINEGVELLAKWAKQEFSTVD